MVAVSSQGLHLALTCQRGIALPVRAEGTQVQMFRQSQRDSSASEKVRLVHPSHRSDAALRLEWRRAFAVPSCSAEHQALAKPDAVVADYCPVEDADVVQHGIRPVAVVVALACVLLHAQSRLEVSAVTYLITHAVVERVAAVAVLLLLPESIIKRYVEARREVVAETSKQLVFGVLLHRLGIDKEREAPARHVVDERHKSQLSQRLHLSVQIDIGVNLFDLLLRQERQLKKVLNRRGIDVQRMLRKLLQLLKMQLQILFFCPLHIACVLLHEVVPVVLLCMQRGCEKQAEQGQKQTHLTSYFLIVYVPA